MSEHDVSIFKIWPFEWSKHVNTIFQWISVFPICRQSQALKNPEKHADVSQES